MLRPGGSTARSIDSNTVENSTVESNRQPHAACSRVFPKSAVGRRQTAKRFSRVMVLFFACLQRCCARQSSFLRFIGTDFGARGAIAIAPSRSCSHATWGPTTERNDSRRPGRGTEAPPFYLLRHDADLFGNREQ